jgi:hypothetical protein
LKNKTVIIRLVDGIGIDKFANGYLIDGTPVKRKFYNGRLCYVHKNKRVGYKTLKNSPPIKLIIEETLPF